MRHDNANTLERLNRELHRMRRSAVRKGGFKSIRHRLRCAERKAAILSSREG